VTFSTTAHAADAVAELRECQFALRPSPARPRVRGSDRTHPRAIQAALLALGDGPEPPAAELAAARAAAAAKRTKKIRRWRARKATANPTWAARRWEEAQGRLREARKRAAAEGIEFVKRS
jgi:CTP:molybdopterin cytidylyltransferase MocA